MKLLHIIFFLLLTFPSNAQYQHNIEKLLAGNLRFEVFNRSKLVLDTTIKNNFSSTLIESISAEPVTSKTDTVNADVYHSEVFTEGQIKLLVEHLTKLVKRNQKQLQLQNDSYHKTSFCLEMQETITVSTLNNNIIKTQGYYTFQIFFKTIKL